MENMATSRPNILWYCTDQQRFDTIRAMGNPHIRTPSLDKLVGAGTAFENAYVQSPICTPSRASFLTGRYPASTHVHRNGNARFPECETLVTKILAEAGYDCGLVGKLHLASAANGREPRTDDGYRAFHYSHHPMPAADHDCTRYNDYTHWLTVKKQVDPAALYGKAKSFCCEGMPAELHQSTWCTEMAISFIDEPRDGPWMLSVNPFDPHPPFDPPKSFLDRYNSAELPPPLFRDTDLERQKQFRNICQQTVQATDPSGENSDEPTGMGVTSAATRPPASFNGGQVKAAYYAMIELLDQQFGRLIDHLDAKGALDDTLIIFHSDHGEQLGDHGLLLKGCRFFEGLVHVPLIFCWAGQIKAGIKSDALVELVDIAPTILDAAGIDIPYFMQGKSLMPLLRGQADPHHHKDRVVAEFNDALGSAEFSYPTHATMTFDGRHKMVVYHGHGFGELFDLHADPGEFDNLWDDPGAQDLRHDLLHKHLDAVMSTSDAGIERVGKF